VVFGSGSGSGSGSGGGSGSGSDSGSGVFTARHFCCWYCHSIVL
jgi:hypothetical protein